MTLTHTTSTNAPRPAGPYSQAVRAGDFVHTAGFGPQNPATGVVPEGIREQTRQVLRNVQAALADQRATMADVVKVTAHLEHLDEDFAGYNEAYAEFFTAPYPVRTTVGSTLANILVEIDVVAYSPVSE